MMMGKHTFKGYVTDDKDSLECPLSGVNSPSDGHGFHFRK